MRSDDQSSDRISTINGDGLGLDRLKKRFSINAGIIVRMYRRDVARVLTQMACSLLILVTAINLNALLQWLNEFDVNATTSSLIL